MYKTIHKCVPVGIAQKKHIFLSSDKANKIPEQNKSFVYQYFPCVHYFFLFVVKQLFRNGAKSGKSKDMQKERLYISNCCCFHHLILSIVVHIKSGQNWQKSNFYRTLHAIISCLIRYLVWLIHWKCILKCFFIQNGLLKAPKPNWISYFSTYTSPHKPNLFPMWSASQKELPTSALYVPRRLGEK